MKLDILAFGAHPDDIELSCSGTLIKAVKAGKKVGIVDLTEGQLGTRGNAELRLKESAAAAKIIGASARDNLGMMDGYFKNDGESRIKLIQKIRQYCPDIVIANAPSDRHPDHGRASEMVTEACFYAGLVKIETEWEGKKQQAFRPGRIFYYMQHLSYDPAFLVDISDEFEKKIESIKAFGSQFHNPESKEPETVLSSPRYLEHIRERASNLGYIIGVKYAEGFMVQRKIFGVNNIFEIL
ncbi:MAG: bacillithiol biosynthesis deacetylase BshB1 [Bacteroidia bacterium]